MPALLEGRDPTADLIRSGDAERIAEHFYPVVRSFVRRFIAPCAPDLIETAASDTLLAICRYGHTFRGRSRPTTWIYQIARRKALACLRSEAAYRARFCSADDPAVTQEIALASRVTVHPRARRVGIELLASLVPNRAWREIWIMTNDPDLLLSDEETAAATGYTPGSVAVIRSKVRQRIARGEIEAVLREAC